MRPEGRNNGDGNRSDDRGSAGWCPRGLLVKLPSNAQIGYLAMVREKDGVTFSVVSAGARRGWRVQIRFGGERIQYIYGFDSPFDANEWIEREAAEWMKGLGAEL
jgi:hypothetical protein